MNTKMPDEIKKGQSFSEYLDEALSKVTFAPSEEEQDRVRTPDEIKKGLEKCISGTCYQCPYNRICEEHLAVGGDSIPPGSIFRDYLALIQQLERERDAMFKSLQRGRSCLDCAKYNVGMYKNNTACQGCSFGSNWQWRGVQEVE